MNRVKASYNTSLFFALSASFIGIIALLMSFNLLTYMYFHQNARTELIRNTSLNLNATVTHYEKHFQQLKIYLMNYIFRSDTQTLAESRNRPVNYEMFRQVQSDLQSALNNPILYINNIIYYFRDKDLLIDKNGTRDPRTMFSKLYVSSTYQPAFWNEEMDKRQSFHIYAGEPFREQTAFGQTSLGNLMPVLAKKEYDNQFAFIALLDASSMYAEFHQPVENEWFSIFDPQGRLVFAAGDRSDESDSKFSELTGQGSMVLGDSLYLYKRAKESGYLYVDMIPIRHITEPIKRLNFIFVMIVIISLLLSLTLSFLVARRFQNPLRGLVQAIEELGSRPAPRQSRIKEFNVLFHKVQDLFQSHRHIHRDLDAKNSLLQHYAYISRLKMISADVANIRMAIDSDKPYRLILLHLVLNEQSQADIAIEPHRAYALIKEMIQLHFSANYPDSLTFQIEQDRILTVLFEQPERPLLADEVIEPLTARLLPETLYFYFTIGVSPMRKDASQFAETYDHVAELVNQRTLGEHIQVFTEMTPTPLPLIPTLAQEQELATNLNVGNDTICIPLVNRLMEQLEKANAPAQQVRALGRQIVEKAVKVIYAQNLSVAGYENPKKVYEQLNQCYTLEQYKQFFQQLLSAHAQSIRSKKTEAESDYMVTFVKDYIQSHLGGDLSLDLLAQKLNITSSYLSTYFKEKTGVNLSEYTHVLRMEKAMEMLQNTDLKIQDIAALVGYLTVAPFNRAFKRHTGATPTEYRRQR
ncbi:helix-turn-helix domain-containing protein [Paenibacillus hodogayensis]|uniref:Helix-turn-helix domain-containing protein n=1 Tax=Paenibacillus hodogayensis TaxID=279208 RepID=A0ABV5W1G8_9BACL